MQTKKMSEQRKRASQRAEEIVGESRWSLLEGVTRRRRLVGAHPTPEESRAASYRARKRAARAAYALARLEASQRIKRVGPGAYLMRRRYFAGE